MLHAVALTWSAGTGCPRSRKAVFEIFCVSFSRTFNRTCSQLQDQKNEVIQKWLLRCIIIYDRIKLLYM